MKPNRIWANFSVQDVNRTKDFYSRLGFTPNVYANHPGLVSFRFGESDFVIHFFEQGSQIDEYLPPGIKTGEVIFTLSADSETIVTEWMDKVKDAGGLILSHAGRDKTSHYGFAFADPDGHRFNILLMEDGM